MVPSSAQTYANHTRRDPLFHFFLLPVLAVSLGVSVYVCLHRPSFLTAWGVVFVVAVIITALKARMYALKVQDRVIRLEERLRLAQLVPESQPSQMVRLSEEQLIGLRFASDAELPALASRALAENLTCAQIKRSVKTWRPDEWRV